MKLQNKLILAFILPIILTIISTYFTITGVFLTVSKIQAIIKEQKNIQDLFYIKVKTDDLTKYTYEYTINPEQKQKQEYDVTAKEMSALIKQTSIFTDLNQQNLENQINEIIIETQKIITLKSQNQPAETEIEQLNTLSDQFTTDFDAQIKKMGQQLVIDQQFLVDQSIQGLYFLIGFVILATISAIAGIFLIFRPALNVLTNFQKVVTDIANGDLNKRLDNSKKISIEITQVIDIFNNMLNKLQRLQNNLEKEVAQRTQQLQNRTEEAEKLNNVMVERELKMVELKKKIAELEEKKIV